MIAGALRYLSNLVLSCSRVRFFDAEGREMFMVAHETRGPKDANGKPLGTPELILVLKYLK